MYAAVRRYVRPVPAPGWEHPPVLAALGDAFPLAVGVALSPLPIMAVLLILPGPTGRAGGLAFLAGRLLAVGVIVAASIS